MESIRGLNRLINKLERMSKASVRESLEKSCLMVEADAKINCPVDDGQLRQSITSEVSGDTGIVGTNIEYAPYVHQGTGIYAVKGDGRQDKWSYQDAEGKWHTTIGQKPNPFLEKALDSNREDIKKLFKEGIRRAANG